MQCKRGGLVPTGDAVASLDDVPGDPRRLTPGALHYCTRFDQVDQQSGRGSTWSGTGVGIGTGKIAGG